MSEGFTTEGRTFIPRSTYRNLHASAGDVVVAMIQTGGEQLLISQAHVIDDLLDIRNAKPWLAGMIDPFLTEVTWVTVVKGERVVAMARDLLAFVGEPTDAG